MTTFWELPKWSPGEVQFSVIFCEIWAKAVSGVGHVTMLYRWLWYSIYYDWKWILIKKNAQSTSVLHKTIIGFNCFSLVVWLKQKLWVSTERVPFTKGAITRPMACIYTNQDYFMTDKQYERVILWLYIWGKLCTRVRDGIYMRGKIFTEAKEERKASWHKVAVGPSIFWVVFSSPYV